MKNRVRVFVETIVLSMNINKINKVLKDMYNMKKFKFLILMLCSIISLASCSDSDEYTTEQKTKNQVRT